MIALNFFHAAICLGFVTAIARLSSKGSKYLIIGVSINSCQFTGEVISEEYVLEYGTDRIEMHVGAVQHGDRVLIVDDLIATGGTLCAAIKLLGKSTGNLTFINCRYGTDIEYC